MSATLNHANNPNEIPTLQAAVLYDTYNSGCRAKAFFDQLTARLDGQTQVNFTLWRLDVLEMAARHGLTLGNFGGAEVLMLALRAPLHLPASVLSWVETWAGGRAQGTAALIVLGDSHPPAGSLRQLSQLAQRHGIELFCEPADQPGWQSQIYVGQLLQQAKAITPVLAHRTEEPFQDQFRDWGIND